MEYPQQERVIVKVDDLDLILGLLGELYLEDHPPSYQDAFRALEEASNNSDKYAVFYWDIHEVKHFMNADGYCNVPDEDIHATRILRILEARHDGEVGVNYEYIRCHIMMYFKDQGITPRDTDLCGDCDEKYVGHCEECNRPMCSDHSVEEKWCLSCADDLPSDAEMEDIGKLYIVREKKDGKIHTSEYDAHAIHMYHKITFGKDGINIARGDTWISEDGNLTVRRTL